jgi:SMI1 / KNR4 family (SUKH-1)
MSSALEDLRRWLGALPPPPAPVDWAWVESELGFVLPSDYKEFCDRFGGCRIQWLFVHAPGGPRTISDGKELLTVLFEMPLSR